MLVGMTVSIELAREAECPVVGQLLEFLAYDMSRFDGRPLTDDGRYGYEYLDAYWQEPGSRWPYLIRVGGELTGLALVSRLPTGVSSMSEFLILPKHRRVGVGRAAARRVFGLHPGAWRVTQIARHSEATTFWRQAIPVAFSEHESDGRSRRSSRSGRRPNSRRSCWVNQLVRSMSP